MRHAVTLAIAGLWAAALAGLLSSIARAQRAAAHAALRALTGNTRLVRRAGLHGASGLVFTDATGTVCCVPGMPPADELSRIVAPSPPAWLPAPRSQ